jgi:hypothetical protein
MARWMDQREYDLANHICYVCMFSEGTCADLDIALGFEHATIFNRG